MLQRRTLPKQSRFPGHGGDNELITMDSEQWRGNPAAMFPVLTGKPLGAINLQPRYCAFRHECVIWCFYIHLFRNYSWKRHRSRHNLQFSTSWLIVLVFSTQLWALREESDSFWLTNHSVSNTQHRGLAQHAEEDIKEMRKWTNEWIKTMHCLDGGTTFQVAWSDSLVALRLPLPFRFHN